MQLLTQNFTQMFSYKRKYDMIIELILATIDEKYSGTIQFKKGMLFCPPLSDLCECEKGKVAIREDVQRKTVQTTLSKCLRRHVHHAAWHVSDPGHLVLHDACISKVTNLCHQ